MLDNDETMMMTSLPEKRPLLSLPTALIVSLVPLSGSSIWCSQGTLSILLSAFSAFSTGLFKRSHPPQDFNDHIFANYIDIHVSISRCSFPNVEASIQPLPGRFHSHLTFTKARLTAFCHSTCSLCILSQVVLHYSIHLSI